MTFITNLGTSFYYYVIGNNPENIINNINDLYKKNDFNRFKNYINQHLDEIKGDLIKYQKMFDDILCSSYLNDDYKNLLVDSNLIIFEEIYSTDSLCFLLIKGLLDQSYFKHTTMQQTELGQESIASLLKRTIRDVKNLTKFELDELLLTWLEYQQIIVDNKKYLDESNFSEFSKVFSNVYYSWEGIVEVFEIFEDADEFGRIFYLRSLVLSMAHLRSFILDNLIQYHFQDLNKEAGVKGILKLLKTPFFEKLINYILKPEIVPDCLKEVISTLEERLSIELDVRIKEIFSKINNEEKFLKFIENYPIFDPIIPKECTNILDMLNHNESTIQYDQIELSIFKKFLFYTPNNNSWIEKSLFNNRSCKNFVFKILQAIKRAKNPFLYSAIFASFEEFILSEISVSLQGNDHSLKMIRIMIETFYKDIDLDYKLLFDFYINFKNHPFSLCENLPEFKEKIINSMLNQIKTIEQHICDGYDCDNDLEKSLLCKYSLDDIYNDVKDEKYENILHILGNWNYYSKLDFKSFTAHKILLKAIENNNILITKLLIDRGCDPALQINGSKSAISYAKELNLSDWFINYLERA